MRSMGLSMLAACITYVHTMPHFSNVTLKPNPTSLGQLLSSGVVPIPIPVTDADYVLVENCEADEKIYDVNGAVIAAKSATLSALTDSKLGVDSPYGFRAMFKSDDAKIAVQAILEGVTWYRGRRGLKPNPDVPSQPRLACVTEDTAELYASLDLGYDPWQRCLAGSPRKSPPPAFYAEGTVYTFLCPAFFVQTPEPYAAHCPTVHNNRFAGDPNSFYKKYQVYTLVYQLVRFYLGVDALDEHTDPPEQFDWNECVRLKTLDSVINPTNIQIYIALVAQGCMNTPDPIGPFILSSNTKTLEALPASSSAYDPWLATISQPPGPSQTAASSEAFNEPQSLPAMLQPLVQRLPDFYELG